MICDSCKKKISLVIDSETPDNLESFVPLGKNYCIPCYRELKKKQVDNEH